jgi:mRNA-degrading endonuclease RelE of RelBE toxin-antitoxin system
MARFRLTKQATKKLKSLTKSDIDIARRIKSAILSLGEGDMSGEPLQGSSDCFKIRIGKYRLIHTTRDGVLIIAIIEKRETVYKTFQHLMKNSHFLAL